MAETVERKIDVINWDSLPCEDELEVIRMADIQIKEFNEKKKELIKSVKEKKVTLNDESLYKMELEDLKDKEERLHEAFGSLEDLSETSSNIGDLNGVKILGNSEVRNDNGTIFGLPSRLYSYRNIGVAIIGTVAVTSIIFVLIIVTGRRKTRQEDPPTC